MHATAIAAAATAILLAAGCSSAGTASPPSGGKPVNGGTASYYMLSGSQPNWIFPFDSPAYSTVSDTSDFQMLMYRPLYWFGGENTSPTLDPGLSTASPPVYSNGGKTVTITLKGWKWSDGETVDVRDVVFWLHTMQAEYQNWFGFVPGGIPQNITSITATGPLQVTLHLNQAYSSLWYTYNELSQVTPMPMAWDVTSLGAKPGSGGCTTDTAAGHWARCKAVYNFLTAQAKDTAAYATSPIWSVTDGPWRLKTFSTDGNDVFVPNPKYSGTPRPRLAAFRFITYTSDSAEYTALQTGQLNVGLVPPASLPVKTPGQTVPPTSPLGPGYALQPAYSFAIYFYRLNFHNPAYGPLFRQLYARQALEYLVDQQGMAKTIYRGYGYPTTGPAPAQPPSQWIPPVQQGAGPYPFSTAKAASLLTSHGWAKQNGVMTCTAPAKCGPGIAKGMQFKITLDYSTAEAAFAQEVQVYKSDAAKAGIILNTIGQTFNTIVGEALPCSGASCTWQAAMAGGWLYAPDYEPTGEELFATGAGANKGSYSSPTMDQLIAATTTSGSLATYRTYATYGAQQLPYIWMPGSYGVMAVSKNLHGVAFNPLETLLPEYWYHTKS
jgi:peptide/nickel transport system substrate-binding protein